MNVVAVEFHPVRVGHRSGITVLYEVDLELFGIEVYSGSGRFAVDLGVFFGEIGPNLWLDDSQRTEVSRLCSKNIILI